jgi:uncharacterized protein (DUF1697 family)
MTRNDLKPMARYVALVRGLNVGGKNLIKMDVLRSVCESAGLRNVKTFLQAGNVTFESNSRNPTLIAAKIEKQLLDSMKREMKAFVFPLEDLARITKRDPFKRIEPGDVMLCVVFFVDEPTRSPKLPVMSTTDKLELIAVHDRAAFVVARRKQNGWFGFPNGFVEKQLGVIATTRQWSTIKKFVAFAERE